MQRQRRSLILVLATVVAVGALAASGFRLAFPEDARPPAAAPVPGGGAPAEPDAAALVAPGPSVASTPLHFPALLLREPPVRPGLGSVLASRPVRAGERIPGSPYASWLRREKVLATSAGVEVALWSAGSGDPPAPGKGSGPTQRLPADPIDDATRSWLLTTTVAGRTSVLTLHDSPAAFARDDLECADGTTVPIVREVRAKPSTLWIEVEERWTCRPPGAAVPAQAQAGEDEDESAVEDAPALDDGAVQVERRLGFVVVADGRGGLWRLASSVPLRETGSNGEVGALAVTFTEGTLAVRPKTPGLTEEQEDWVGAHPLDLALQQVMAAPTWVDEYMPAGPVSATCAPGATPPRILIVPDPPVTLRPWARNPEVMVLAVPRGVGRVRVRAVSIEPDGTRVDVSDDPCFRLQLVGGGLRPMAVRTLYEVVGGNEPLEGSSLVAMYRGQRIIMRAAEGPPMGPAIPPAAAALLAGAFPGLHPPDAASCPGWDLFDTGPGVVVGDVDGDGRDDVVALLLDEDRWEVAVLTATARGDFQLAFNAGAPRARTAPGEPAEELSLRLTEAGDVSIRREQGRKGDEWIIRWGGKAFQRTVLPLLRPGSDLTADRLGIAPRGTSLDERTVARGVLLTALAAGDAEAFSALDRMAPERKAEAAAWVVDGLLKARGDRTRLLVALAVLGKPAAGSAVNVLGGLLFGRTEPWRSEREARAAEWALGRMGEPALLLLALHPRDSAGALAAADILREEPQLRTVYAEALRGNARTLAVALEPAPIATPGELVEALGLMRTDRGRVLGRLRGLAHAGARSPEGAALIAAAVPALAAELSARIPPADAAAVARLLGEFGPPAAQAVPALEAALEAPDCRLRVAARAALAAIRGRGLPPGDEDLVVECGVAAGRRARSKITAALRRPAAVPAGTFVVRNLEQVDERGYGFAAPVDLDVRALARGQVPGVDLETGRGPRVEEARLRATRNGLRDECLRFQAALPAPLRRAHYYGVTSAGVEPLDPQKVLGSVCVGAQGIAGVHGKVEAGAFRDGFIIVSGAALTVSDVSSEALDRLWPAVAAACGVDPASPPQGIAFRLSRGSERAQYAYAVLPAGDVCWDRRRLLRIERGAAEVVEASDTGCEL